LGVPLIVVHAAIACPPGRHAAAENGRVHVDDLNREFIEIEHRDTAAAGAFAQYPPERHDWAFLVLAGLHPPFI
jgi:hypothetical protein